MKEFWVVGCYENPNHTCYPTHASPILIVRTEEGYQRLVYKIVRPYRIEPILLTGPIISSPSGTFFPHPTYMLCEPRRCNLSNQFVIFGKSLVYSNSSRLLISVRIVWFSISQLNRLKQSNWRRIWLVLRSTWDC